MRDLKACTVCLSTIGELHNMDTENRRNDYNLLSGLKTNKNNGLPSYLCVECLAYTRKFKAFREKCQRAYFTLQELLRRNKEITTSSLLALDKNIIGVARNISQMDVSNIYWEQTYCQWDTATDTKLNQSIPIAHYSTYNNEIEFSLPTSTKTEPVKARVVSPIQVKELEYSSDDCGNEPDNLSEQESEDVTLEPSADGLDEFMTWQPLTDSQARASLEILNTLHSPGRFKCEQCFKGYSLEDKLKMHIKLVHAAKKRRPHVCAVCGESFRSRALLRRHRARHAALTCRACRHVCGDRSSAKRHLAQCGRTPRAAGALLPHTAPERSGKSNKKEPDFDNVMTTTLIAPLEMYALVAQRKLTRNYTTSRYKCELCYRGFTCSNTYGNHMRKHAEPAGALQCDVCGVRAPAARGMYKHMISTHIHKYTCKQCEFLCYNRSQAYQHYRFHRNYVYKCPHCPQEFKKSSTHLTHIRIKHPSTRVCDICGHSFVSLAGMRYHRVRAHSKEELAASEGAAVDRQSPRYCAPCDTQFATDAAFDMHLGSSSNHADKNL